MSNSTKSKALSPPVPIESSSGAGASISTIARSKRHHAFSGRRVAAICRNTVTELTRLKIFYVLLLFALVLIGGSVFLARFSFQQEFQILKDVSLGTMSIFSSLL